MKNMWVKFSGGAAAVSMMIAAFAFTGAPLAVSAAGGSITVSAQGAVSVKPDVAYVEVGLQTTAKDAATAQADNAKQFESLMAALKKAGVKDEDVKTSNYYVYAQYDYNVPDKTGEKTNKIRDYICGDTVTITVNNIDDAAKIVDAAGQNGATQINGVRFTVKDTAEAYDKALQNAYASALKRAKTLAKTAGVTLGAPASIQENGSYYAPQYYGNVKEMAADTGAAVAGAPTQFYTSDLDVTASVTVTFGY